MHTDKIYKKKKAYLKAAIIDCTNFEQNWSDAEPTV